MKVSSISRKGLATTAIASMSALAAFFLPYTASANIDVTGWSWSENVGWIMFGAPQGGTLTLSDAGAGEYFLNGWGWSENVGWIEFGALANYPSGNGTYYGNAKLDASGNLKGWARACAGTANGDCNSASRTDGWDGWISLGGTGYGTPQNIGYNRQSWYSWGSDVIGWLHVGFDPFTADATVVPRCGGGTDNTVAISWKPPPPPYASSVSSYTVNVKDQSGNYQTQTFGNGSSSYLAQFSGLTSGNSYTAEVITTFSGTFGTSKFSQGFSINSCPQPVNSLGCDFQSGDTLQSMQPGNYPESSSNPPVRPLVGKPVLLTVHIRGGNPPYRVVWTDEELPSSGTTQTSVPGGTYDENTQIWSTDDSFTRIYSTVGPKTIGAYVYNYGNNSTNLANADITCSISGVSRPILKAKPRFQDF